MDIQEIDIPKIEFDKEQPRKDIVRTGELASSIRKEGLINPIEVWIWVMVSID